MRKNRQKKILLFLMIAEMLYIRNPLRLITASLDALKSRMKVNFKRAVSHTRVQQQSREWRKTCSAKSEKWRQARKSIKIARI